MQHFTLSLFRKDDSRHELRILDAQQQTLFISPPIDQGEVDPLLELAESQYRVLAPDLRQQGQALFDWVDSNSGGWLRGVRQTPQHMALTIDMEKGGLRHLPWELLHDGSRFLCADPLHLFTPLRRTAGTQNAWETQKRQLSVLFMASSPEEVEPVLNFEAEEADILEATAKKPIDLQVEESGSLQGLEERLQDMEFAPDVIHLSGHADVDNDQPVFLLEDDIGNVAPATPDDLAQIFVAADSYPRIAFLSGCRTGETRYQRNMLSFSEHIVKAGVPVVLGWALPVGDNAASQAAAALYEKLATGFDIALAVAYARQQLLENHSPYWHLLRCFIDQSSLNALVSKGRLRVRTHSTRQQFLDAGGKVSVCARTEFVGRRRLLQRCLRSLRAWYGQPDYAEGVLLYGMGGLGKSSAAARLVERLRGSHQAVVCYGGLDETTLIAALGKALPNAPALLNDAEQTLLQRLRSLFEPLNNQCTDRPLLLVFDDFEQNIPLQARKQGKAAYSPASLETLHSVLQAIHDSQADTRLIVTSRFGLDIPSPWRLYAETPKTLHDADLNKKLAKLPGLQAETFDPAHTNNPLRCQAIAVAAGNPRLLEQLSKVLQSSGLDAEALLKKLEQTEQVFREDVLISELVEAQPAAVRHSLACAALYRLPLPLVAMEALTEEPQTEQQLRAAAQVGLVEITPTADGDHYFVSTLLDDALLDELSDTERQQLAGKASRHLYQSSQEYRPEALALEIVRLAIEGKAQDIAVAVGDNFANNMLYYNRYREADALCRQVLTLGEDFRMLTQLALAEQKLGHEGITQHIERAVELLPDDRTALSNELLWDCAYTMGAYADILQARGQLDEALKIREHEQLPVYEQLGDVREKAKAMGKIAGILQVRGLLDEALNMLRNDVLPAFEKLGDVREKAVTLGKIADILQARGQLDEALKIREHEELPVYEQLGDVRELVVCRAKLAMLLWQMDAQNKAAQAQELLCWSLTEARRLHLPEAKQLEDILQQMNLDCQGQDL